MLSMRYHKKCLHKQENYSAHYDEQVWVNWIVVVVEVVGVVVVVVVVFGSGTLLYMTVLHKHTVLPSQSVVVLFLVPLSLLNRAMQRRLSPQPIQDVWKDVPLAA